MFLGPPASSYELSRLSMEVSLLREQRYGTYALHVRLSNHDKTPVPVAIHHLPWEHSNRSLPIDVYRLDDPQQALPKHFIWRGDLFKLETRDIQPGELLEGNIYLSALFRSLKKEIKQHGVTIVWKCELDTIPVVCTEGGGGSFTIPKGGLDK